MPSQHRAVQRRHAPLTQQPIDEGIEPEGGWYQETGQGMGATLAVAAEKDAYTISDRGTYLSNEQGSALDISSRATTRC